MNAIETINQFVEAMISSQTKFQDIKAEVDRRNHEVEECISGFQSGIREVMRNGGKVKNAELQEIINRQLAELENLLNIVAASLEATQKGMKFIHEYEDSFNIAVFGKVKAGKSYTGNFIMGNVIRDMGIHTSYDKLTPPTVTVIDRGKKSTQAKLAEFDEAPKVKQDVTGAKEFVVDPNEATSTIQLFRLGGMRWVDTPGIGSVNWENEMLAKNFVDNADLIVYMSNSDAAGTQQDFTEMKELYAKKKRFLLLLTQSDDVEDDVDDDGNMITILIPKSDADRKSMETYICETLDKEGIRMDKEREVLTISTKLALEGLKTKDEAMFDASNLEKFLEVLVNITQNDAAKLKLATPTGRINIMIDEIVKGLCDADAKLSEHMKSLDDTRRKLSERNDYLLSNMLNECMTEITRQVEQKAADVESRGSGVSAEDLQRIVGSEIFRIVMETCAKEFEGSKNILSGYSDSLKIGNVTGLEMRHDTITWKRQVSERYERDPDGAWETVKSWFGARYYSYSTRTVTESRNIDLGVNTAQVLSEVRSNIDAIFREQVPAIMKKLADDLIAPVAQVRKNAGEKITSAISRLEGLKKC